MALGSSRRRRQHSSHSSDDDDADADDARLGSSRRRRSHDKKHARRPPMSAWRAQKLPAWQPLMTPKTTISVLFLTGLIVAPIGAVLFYFSMRRDYIALDYTQCKSRATATLADMPTDKYTYQIDNSPAVPAPQWAYIPNDAAPAGSACRLVFSVPNTLATPVLLAYKLTNFHQNHRKYVKGVDTGQMNGEAVPAKDLDTLCRPFATEPETGKAIYPCGLIANSMFNDTFSHPIVVNQDGTLTTTPFTMSETNLVLASERSKYTRSSYNPADVVPPLFWRGSARGPYGYAGGYSADAAPSTGTGTGSNTTANATDPAAPRPLFDPTTDEHFMVWMNTAALPNFEKLYKRSDSTPMGAGRYAVDVFDNWPVEGFHGTKSLVLTTTGWNGSRNLLLGLVTLGTGGFCLLLSLVFAARHVIKPRKLGSFK